ncbi:hypothetical protein SAMN04488564_1196 [Lentzea waywayandensis]|uniref:Uncharacterized protein n=1 Tax=Lentzea waywayandensis TaxID=84724 RepID=A0A1I6FHF1_9PSEU|nr:hypothetical protein SAMN04488564_1196 [Lentzea waywayandensis]
MPIIGAPKLESNLDEVALTREHIARLSHVSRPELDYPAGLHGELRAMVQFAGTTVDGEASRIYPPLLQSDVRY